MQVSFMKYDKQISLGITIMLPFHAGDKHWDIIIDLGIWAIEFTFNGEKNEPTNTQTIRQD